MIPNDISAKLNAPTGRPQARPAGAAHAAEERAEAGEAKGSEEASEDVVTLSKSAARSSPMMTAAGTERSRIADERAAGIEARSLRQAVMSHPAQARGTVGAMSGAAAQLAALLSE